MVLFAIIYNENKESILGSDSLIPLDGRLNTHNALEIAKEKALRLKKLKPWIDSVRIHKGNLKFSSPVTDYQKI